MGRKPAEDHGAQEVEGYRDVDTHDTNSQRRVSDFDDHEPLDELGLAQREETPKP